MAELALREAKVLKALSKITGPVRASDLEGVTGEIALNIGKALVELAQGDLVQMVDKKRRLG